MTETLVKNSIQSTDKVCVIGLGYVGLPTAALLAARGMNVLGVDQDAHLVETINKGSFSVSEPHLDVLLRGASESGRLSAATKPDKADVFIIATELPTQESSYPLALDAEEIFNATRNIAPLVQPGNLILLESIASVGCTEKVAQILTAESVDINKVHLAYSPERVMPGRIIVELVENDRVVGGRTPECARHAKTFYQNFVTGEIHETTCRCAEMVKLTESAFRDVNIAFANELSILCANLEIDVSELIRLANCHPRVKILNPSCGVGGQAVAAAPAAIAKQHPTQTKLIQAARKVNDSKTTWVIERIRAGYRVLEKPRPCVALCGLTFKPDVDDLTASPALIIAQTLAKETDAEFLFVEPNVKSAGNLLLTPLSDALDHADLIVKLVNHREFENAFDDIEVPYISFTS